MTKQETKTIERARVAGRGALLRTMAIVHRSASTRTQCETVQSINHADVMDYFIRVYGALVHQSEI